MITVEQRRQIDEATRVGRKRASVIVLSTHATQLYGPPDALHDYILRRKPSYYVFIRHPLDIGLNRSREILYYKKGILVERKQLTESKNGFWQFIKDFFFNRRILREIIRETGLVDLYIGANPLNYFSGSLAIPRRLVHNWVFYSVDYSPQRFTNPILNGIYRFIDDWAARQADITFAVTKRAILERVKRGARPEKMVHTPNGVVDMTNLTKGIRRVSQRVVYVGTLSKEKGIQDVLEAWVEINRVVPNASLVIIGSGADERYLKGLTKKLKLKRVEFLGQLNHDETVKEVSRSEVGIALYNNADSYTHFCDPMKVREYLASGVVPVVSAVPEIAVQLAKRKAGEIIKDSNDTAECLIKALTRTKDYQKGIVELAKGNKWDEVFAYGFGKAGLAVTERPWRRIMTALWNPGEAEIAAGGFRRCHEILKRFKPEDGILLAVDAKPSIMSGCESRNLIVINYDIPRWLKRLEKRYYNVERILEWLFSMWQITKIGWRERKYIDTVFVPFSEIIVTSFGAGILKWLARLRVVFCNENTDPKWLTRTLNNWFHNHVDRSFTISKDLARALEKQGIKGPLPINYTGLDVSLLKTISRQSKKYDAVFIGRHAETKGIYDYVKMLPTVTKAFPKFKFLSVGMVSPDVKKELTELLEKNGTKDHWQFAGVVSERKKYELIKQSRSVWFLSTLEGWGIVPQEALACGVMPLCYDISVYRENVRSCEAVRFVKPHDWQAAAQAAIAILKLDIKRKREIEAEGESFVEQFDWEVVAQREFDVVNGVELGIDPQKQTELLL